MSDDKENNEEGKDDIPDIDEDQLLDEISSLEAELADVLGEEVSDLPAEGEFKEEGEGDEESLNEKHFTEEAKEKKPLIPKWLTFDIKTALANPNKSKTILIGFIIAFAITPIFSYMNNVKVVILASQMAQKPSDLYLMDKCVSIVFFFFLGLSVLTVGVSFLKAFNWKKSIILALLAFGLVGYYFQFKMIPYLQRLREAKLILEKKKRVPPFVNSTWESFFFANVEKIVDTGMKISIHVYPGKIKGVYNNSGKTAWSYDTDEKFIKDIVTSIYIGGTDVYFYENGKLISLNIVTGVQNWIVNFTARALSNFSYDEGKIAFYCRNCQIPGVKIQNKKKSFYSHIVVLGNERGKVIYSIYIKESASQMKKPLPKIHFFDNSFYAVFEKDSRLLKAQDGKILNAKINLDEFKDTSPVSMKEALGLEKREVFKRAKDQKAYFEGGYLILNSIKWMRFYDLKNVKLLWQLSKGFVSGNTKIKDPRLYSVRYRDINIFLEKGVLYSVKMRDGKMKWGPKVGRYLGPLAIVGRKLFVNSLVDKGSIHAFHASRGKFLFSWSQHKGIKDLISWKDYIVFKGKDNMGLTKIFGFFAK